MRKLLPLLLILLSLNARVQAQCNAAFTTSQYGSTVHVMASHNAPGWMHTWKFGDGQQGWGQHAFHTYAAPGTYTIKHIVNDSLSICRDSVTQTVTISPSVTCTASYAYKKDSLNSSIFHFWSTSSGNGSNIISYNWKINGVSVSTDSAFTDSIAYRDIICLYIETDAGCEKFFCDSVAVDTPSDCHLNAAFVATVNGPAALVMAADSTPHILHSWKFGDGAIAFGRNASRTYQAAGTYIIMHYVRDSANHCIDSSSKTFVVEIPVTCKAAFTFFKDSVQPNKYYFYSTSTATAGIITSHKWWINNIFASSAPVFSYNLPPGGNSIRYELTTSTGCTDGFIDSIWVNDSAIDENSIMGVPSFPNPANGSFVNLQLNLEDDAKVRITVYNSYGTVVYKNEQRYGEGSNRVSIPVEKLQQGQYFIDIQYGNVRKRSRFQKF